MELKSLIRAANITDIKSPFSGEGIKPRTNRGYAVFVQLVGLLQYSRHCCGSTHATSSVYNILLIIPGITIKKSGSIFR